MDHVDQQVKHLENLVLQQKPQNTHTVSRTLMNTDQQPSSVPPQCLSQICGVPGVSMGFKQNVEIPSKTPKLSIFSGDDHPVKYESNFKQWLFEVKTLQ